MCNVSLAKDDRTKRFAYHAYFGFTDQVSGTESGKRELSDRSLMKSDTTRVGYTWYAVLLNVRALSPECSGQDSRLCARQAPTLFFFG